MKLSIVTPFIRTNNLPKLYDSLVEGRKHLPVRWFLLRDGHYRENGASVAIPDWEWVKEPWIHYRDLDVEGIGGERLVNTILGDLEPEEFWWFLADDNLPHPGFFPRMAQLDGKAGCYSWCQMYNGRRQVGNIYHPGAIDAAQYAIRRDFLGDLRFDSSMWTIADGVLVEELHKRSPEGFVYLDETLSFYNLLR